MSPTDATKDLFSIGCLCGQLQHSFRSIEAAAARLKMAPVLRLNGTPHFDGLQVEKIAAELRGTTKTGGRKK